jgi:3-methyladenine DNA glycosylase/8-oxoguanine DNA glycosylase
VVQAAQQHHARRQERRQCQPDFAVWKTVALDLLWHQARGNGQAQRGGRLVFKVQQGGGI